MSKNCQAYNPYLVHKFFLTKASEMEWSVEVHNISTVLQLVMERTLDRRDTGAGPLLRCHKGIPLQCVSHIFVRDII